MKRTGWLAVAAIVWLGGRDVMAQEKAASPEPELRAVIEASFAATEKKDVDAVKATLHSQSPAAAATVEAQRQLLKDYDIKVELIRFRYIGADGEYAIARGAQKTTKLKGPEFRDNTLDSLFIFRKEGDQWKLWQQWVLETKYAN